MGKLRPKEMAFVAPGWLRGQRRAGKQMQARGGRDEHSCTAVLIDVMDTIVVDPFSVSMHSHFGFESKSDFLRAKRPNTWVPFEKGEISEEEFFETFFLDGREVDVRKFQQYLRDSYRWIEGMDTLLSHLKDAGVEIHLLSNYPVWWKLVEESLQISRFAPWTFVSCHTGLRKPDPSSFLSAAKHLNRETKHCILVDDRVTNCDAAIAAGYLDAIVFKSADQARKELQKYFNIP
eukprot:Plantae.Rhodophyta-Purpureofilum_apyrenoidigerum.ctg35990.p1 GENE.Plantae.Rhodophyta-Purpureofilum_apyrenoidigerum.ctg35990~~Plantae.Rhodophyta-Purpureofilum_apyrenoidigerum.ctg35990.p1  ORF type:complete len:234 (+),score=35.60 Plantae.Rhodophyta-Purpureofilum_apyrenoidigerum.ctg35990:208-909(+)